MANSLLSRSQRDFVAVDTGIDRLLIDRCVEGFDALIAGRLDEYEHKMATAWVQMGFGPGNPIKANDRPTALDRIKTICLRAYADREHISFQKAAKRLKEMQQG